MPIDFQNPIALAGLAVMSGHNLGDALAQAAQTVQDQQYKKQQMDMEQQKTALLAMQDKRMQQQYDMQAKSQDMYSKMLAGGLGGGQTSQSSSIQPFTQSGDTSGGMSMPVGGNTPAPTTGGMSMPDGTSQMAPAASMPSYGAMAGAMGASPGDSMKLMQEQGLKMAEPAIAGATKYSQAEGEARHAMGQKSSVAQTALKSLNNVYDTIDNAPDGSFGIPDFYPGTTQAINRAVGSGWLGSDSNVKQQQARDVTKMAMAQTIDPLTKTLIALSTVGEGQTGKLTNTQVNMTLAGMGVKFNDKGEPDWDSLATIPKATLLAGIDKLRNSMKDTITDSRDFYQKSKKNPNLTTGDFWNQKANAALDRQQAIQNAPQGGDPAALAELKRRGKI